MRAGSFTEGERRAISAELLKQCDARDGRADGMIMNVSACRSFDPSPLLCRPGDSGACLNAQKLEALQLAFRGPRDATGRPVYVPIPWDTGIVYQGPGLPGYLPSGAPGPFGPASTAREIDINKRVQDIESDAIGRLTDTAYWTNLSTYLGRGAKICFTMGSQIHGFRPLTRGITSSAHVRRMARKLGMLRRVFTWFLA
jgi:feruloyl esterase